MIEKRTAQLEASNKEMLAFATSVASYLRDPLRAISGFSSALLDDYGAGMDGEARRMLGIVRESAARIDRVISDMLALAHIGQTVLRVSRIDMRAMAIAMYNESAAAEDLASIRFSIAPIPDAEGDPTLLRKAWGCLFSNAVKFTKGIERREIAVGFERKEGETHYFVRDNGVGYDAAYAGRLFGLFERLHGYDAYDGTGVGLPMLKRIIEMHGGNAGAENLASGGAKFWFSIPSPVVQAEGDAM